MDRKNIFTILAGTILSISVTQFGYYSANYDVCPDKSKNRCQTLTPGAFNYRGASNTLLDQNINYTAVTSATTQ